MNSGKPFGPAHSNLVFFLKTPFFRSQIPSTFFPQPHSNCLPKTSTTSRVVDGNNSIWRFNASYERQLAHSYVFPLSSLNLITKPRLLHLHYYHCHQQKCRRVPRQAQPGLSAVIQSTSTSRRASVQARAAPRPQLCSQVVAQAARISAFTLLPRHQNCRPTRRLANPRQRCQ